MKHKLLTAFLALAASLCLCLGLAACNGEPTSPSGSTEDSETETPQHTFTADNVCPHCGEKWEYTEGLEYELDGDTYTVTGIGTASGDIVIPYGHEGKLVTKIADGAFKGSEAVTGIYVPEKIVSVGKAAFAECPNLVGATWDAENCTKAGITIDETMDLPPETNPEDIMIFANSGLKTLTLGERVRSIPFMAFALCNGITSLSVPRGVTYIDVQAFSFCESLKTVQWDAENCMTAVLDDDIHLDGSGSPFTECENLQTVIFGDSVINIPSHLLYYCNSLTNITLGKNVISIGEEAFGSCDSLTSITLGENIKTLGERAFYDCDNLVNIHVTDIATLCNIEFVCNDSYPLGSSDIRHLYLGETEIKELVIPKGVTEVKAAAFDSYTELTSVTFQEGVTSIDKEAFESCSGLTNVSFPNSLVSIGKYAFNCCDSLTSITIPAGVTSIGDYAFQNCNGLTDVQFNGTVDEWLGIIGNNNIWSWNTRDQITVTCTDGTVTGNGTVTRFE